MAIEPELNEQFEGLMMRLSYSGELEISELSHRVSRQVGIAEEQAVAEVRIMRQSSIQIKPYPAVEDA